MLLPSIFVFCAFYKCLIHHYEYVCQHATHGCQQASLATRVPVIFGVLTTPTRELALDRVGGKRGHHGREAAQAGVKMAEIMGSLKRRS